jgi:hypothetical protein
MKKLHLLSVLVYLSYTSFGQITITKNDMPVARDTVRYSTTTTQLNFTNTGPNYTWDFSSLVLNGQGIDTFKSALLINPLFGLLFGLTDVGVPSTNKINFAQLNLTNVYDFYKTSNSYYEINGIGATYSGLPLPTSYTTPDKVYQFPLTYGRTDVSPYDVNISIPGVAGVHQIGTRTNTVDGWGTVITPFDTFQCLRVKSVLSEVDSINIIAVGLSIGIPLPTVTYKWLANGVKIPVLEVQGFELFGAFVPTSEKFRDNYRIVPNRFNLRINFTADKTVCTTDDTVTITPRVRPQGVTGTTYKYRISPNTFNFIAGTDSTSSTPKVKFGMPGLYTVSMHAEAPAGGTFPATADTTKVDYILVSFPAGINNVSSSNIIQVYPNPANDHLAILLDGDMDKEATLELMDMSGKLLYSNTTSQKGEVNIPTAHLSMGEYIFRVTPASGSSYVQKVSIVH